MASIVRQENRFAVLSEEYGDSMTHRAPGAKKNALQPKPGAKKNVQLPNRGADKHSEGASEIVRPVSIKDEEEYSQPSVSKKKVKKKKKKKKQQRKCIPEYYVADSNAKKDIGKKDETFSERAYEEETEATSYTTIIQNERQLCKDIPWTEARQGNLEQVASQYKCSTTDSQKYSFYSSLKDEKMVIAAAKGAAFLAEKAFAKFLWTGYEEDFSEDPDAFKRVQLVVLKILTKFVLSIFDLEDFNRIALKQKMNAERRKFIRDFIVPRETAAEAILAIANGEMEGDNFHLLLEGDVGSILEQRAIHPKSHDCIPELVYMADAHTWSFEDVDVSETVLQSTISIMKQFSPLKRNCAMHLMMELIHGHCHCIPFSLCLETWRDFNFSLLEGFSHVSVTILDDLVFDIYETMGMLAAWRRHELVKSMISATFPLRAGAFGACTKEVIEVVEHAECERRWEGHRFIGTRHLLLGLLCSRIAESVRKFGHFGQATEERSKCPMYDIYKTAQDVASIFGVGKIELEHLFLAIMVVELGINQRPQWAKELHDQKVEGSTMEESLPIILEHMLSGLEIGLRNLDTKAFRRNSLAYEEKTWDADSSSKIVLEIFEGANTPDGCEVSLEDREVWDFLRRVSELCKSKDLSIIRGNGEEKEWDGEI